MLASDQAHVVHDEAGGLEHVAGAKVTALPTVDGLVDPADVERAVKAADNPMRAPVGALTLTQSTELGTTYSLDQLRDLVRVSHDLGVRVHVDGARLANAAVSLGTGPGELTTHLGVDAVSLGGTKNGGGFAEAVVVREAFGLALHRLVKPSMQQSSKTRFVSAQLLALFGGDLWWRTASAANGAARALAEAVSAAGARVTRPVQANAVFAELAPQVAERAAARVPFHVWDPHFSAGFVEVRLVASFDTTAEDVEAFGKVLAEEIAGA